jgi:uncharacterized protein
MLRIDQHRKFVQARSKALAHPHLMAFCASCCERAFPNYVAFWDKEKSGDPRVLRKSLDATWECLHGRTISLDQANILSRECEGVIPDSDDFPSLEVSGAQDAGFGVMMLLEFACDPDLRHVLRIVGFSTDAIDRYIQIAEGMDPGDPDLDIKIDKHPLMTTELNKQKEDLAWLANACE